MTSSVVSPTKMVKKSEFMKNASFNFIENERMSDEVLKGAIHQLGNSFNGTEPYITNSKPETPSRTYSETIHSEPKEAGASFSKRYVTTCYFQPKVNPVSYSETVIVNLDSKKKQYYETALYQTKLIPHRWVERVVVQSNQSERLQEARQEIYLEKPKYHYISLEPQQTAVTA